MGDDHVVEIFSIYKTGNLIYDSNYDNIINNSFFVPENPYGFDLSGRPTDGIEKGICIKDGRKILIR